MRWTERRAPIVPADARLLVEDGIAVTVDDSSWRLFLISDYTAAGCRIALDEKLPLVARPRAATALSQTSRTVTSINPVDAGLALIEVPQYSTRPRPPRRLSR